MGLSRTDKINLGLLVGVGTLLAVSSMGFRILVNHRTFSLPLQLIQIQYSLAYIFLGLLIVLLWKSNTELGKIGLALLTFAVGIGLLFPPVSLVGLEEIAVNVSYLGLVLAGGVVYYRFKKPSNTILIAGVGVMALEHYLFGLVYTIRGFWVTQRPVFVGAIIVLTVILYVIRNILRGELEKTHDQSQLADYITSILDLGRGSSSP